MLAVVMAVAVAVVAVAVMMKMKMMRLRIIEMMREREKWLPLLQLLRSQIPRETKPAQARWSAVCQKNTRMVAHPLLPLEPPLVVVQPPLLLPWCSMAAAVAGVVVVVV